MKETLHMGGSTGMKDIQNYNAPKYDGPEYKTVEDGIYETVEDGETIYVTSLSFVQEPEFGEGRNAAEISQYPLEEILDNFMCYISDFYPDLNTADSQTCYQEFACTDIECLQELRSMIGKHAYEKNAGRQIELVIE